MLVFVGSYTIVILRSWRMCSMQKMSAQGHWIRIRLRNVRLLQNNVLFFHSVCSRFYTGTVNITNILLVLAKDAVTAFNFNLQSSIFIRFHFFLTRLTKTELISRSWLNQNISNYGKKYSYLIITNKNNYVLFYIFLQYHNTTLFPTQKDYLRLKKSQIIAAFVTSSDDSVR